MKRAIYIIVLLALLVLACGGGGDLSTPESTESKIIVYKVIHDTGLYKDNTVESEQLAILRIGHRLTPANGESTPYCENLDAGGGMIIHSCYMESLETGEKGWVISKWMSKVD
jgi:hypothetical protein